MLKSYENPEHFSMEPTEIEWCYKGNKDLHLFNPPQTENNFKSVRKFKIGETLETLQITFHRKINYRN